MDHQDFAFLTPAGLADIKTRLTKLEVGQASAQLRAIEDRRERLKVQNAGLPVGFRGLWNEGAGLLKAVTDDAPNPHGVHHVGRDRIHTFAPFNVMILDADSGGAPRWDSALTVSRDERLEPSFPGVDPLVEASRELRANGLECVFAFSTYRRIQDYGRGFSSTPGSAGFYLPTDPGFKAFKKELFEEFCQRYAYELDGVAFDYHRWRTYGTEFNTPSAHLEYQIFCDNYVFNPAKWYQVDEASIKLDNMDVRPANLDNDRGSPSLPTNTHMTKLRWLDWQAAPIDEMTEAFSKILRKYNPWARIYVYDGLEAKIEDNSGNIDPRWWGGLWEGRNSLWWHQNGWVDHVLAPSYRYIWGHADPDDFANSKALENVLMASSRARWVGAGFSEQDMTLMHANYMDKKAPANPHDPAATAQLLPAEYAEVTAKMTEHNPVGDSAEYITSLTTTARIGEREAEWGDQVVTPWSMG